MVEFDFFFHLKEFSCDTCVWTSGVSTYTNEVYWCKTQRLSRSAATVTYSSP